MTNENAGPIKTLDGDELPPMAKPNPEENPRNQRFKEIADEESQHKKDGADGKADLVDVDTEDFAKNTEVIEEEHKASEPKKYRIKANGQEMELTEEELIKRAEKAEGADQTFQEAARLRREAEEMRRQPPEPELEAVPAVDDDDRALARALQMGSEEEAASVIKRIRGSQPGINHGQIAGMVDLTLSGNWFRAEYPEIFSDPWLTKLALDEDERLVKSGDRRPYKDRYKEVGDKLRAWKGTQAQRTEQKVEKKASLQVVPKADVRQRAPAEDDDGPTDAQWVLEEAKRRGQGFVR